MQYVYCEKTKVKNRWKYLKYLKRSSQCTHVNEVRWVETEKWIETEAWIEIEAKVADTVNKVITDEIEDYGE